MRFICFILLTLSIYACDNSLDLLEDKKETPIVYGFIDAQDTASYIRVERAFSDPNVPAAQIAQNADSLYYDDVVVMLNVEGKEEVLVKVDGDKEGYPRQGGAFAQAPNILYKSSNLNIKPGQNVILTVKGENVDVNTTTTVIGRPFPSNYTGRSLYFDPKGKFNLSWKPGEGNEVYAAILNINYTEIRGTERVDKTLPWIVGDFIDVTRYDFPGISFYRYLRDNIAVENGVERRLNSIGLRLIAGDENIRKYVTVGLANLGITSSGEIPAFSNIPGGIGIFGSTYTIDMQGLPLSENGLIELINHEYTKPLNFKN